jgi:hypothetical protein
LSLLRSDDTPAHVVAILCSDLHLSHKPPIARSVEPDWYKTMGRYLKQLRDLADHHKAPVVCAGDIFDDGWRPHRCPPELINFAIAHLPRMYAIPGQHDLPYHRYDMVERSAYWTLVEAGVIKDLCPVDEVTILPKAKPDQKEVIVFPFPWGFPVKPPPGTSPEFIHLCVAHQYVWCAEKGYPGAPEDQHIRFVLENLRGYDVALFGDNHKGFIWSREGWPTVFNHGTFIRRKSDEREYQPHVGLLYSDGGIVLLPYKTDKDRWIDVASTTEKLANESGLDGELLLAELASLGDSTINFHEAVKRFLEKHNTNDRVTALVMELLRR